ncbi:hypothetical protein IKF03_03220 [Candidatus Saccharibacteria bacterium]|nr:hypothetical protein [Candidatus Saccharibacteria bacterium]
MDKDVVYIEPENDITDIIAKIEGSKQKIIALVPPKKAGVFRSVVNIKLITKAGVSSGKKVVLVTTDPSIMKLAATTRLPVAKDLNSAPEILKPETESEEAKEEEASDEVAEKETETEAEPEAESEDEDKDEAENEDESEDDNKGKKSKEKPKKERKESKNKLVNWVLAHKKISIFSGVGFLALILLLVWAFVLAPAVTIIVGIRTVSNNFSENVSFTSNLTEEKVEEGRFYYEEKKIETINEVGFEATGQKNVGKKAEGSILVSTYFEYNKAGSIVLKDGEAFSIRGLTYYSAESVGLAYNGRGKEDCDNKDDAASLINYGCQVSAKVKVVAAEPGSQYNIPASDTGWDTTANVGVRSKDPMTGGSDEMKTIVAEADVEKAKGEITADNEAEMKKKLYETIDTETSLIIDSSLTVSTAEAISTPAVGEEVGEGVKPVLKAITTASVYVVDKTKVEEFIAKKANLGEGMKIYKMDNPFVENFSKTDEGVIGKLKTAYSTGPKVTENDVVEITKGKGFGVAQHDLRDIDGVIDVRIDKSYPWVTSVPGNANKITVVLEVKE